MKKNDLVLSIFLLSLVSACVPSASKVHKKDSDPATETPVIPTAGMSGVDELKNYLWHLTNTGNNFINGNTGVIGSDINLGNVHSERSGNGVVVAVSDTNIELTHEDLFFNSSKSLSRNYALSSNWEGNYPMVANNTEGHGTSVAGLISASTNNTFGGFGIAPKSTIVGFNYLESGQDAARTVDQTKGSYIDIFNYSYGYSTCQIAAISSSLLNALEVGARTARDGLGAIYVKAAGNDYSGTQSECSGGNKDFYYFGNSNFDQENATPYTIIVGASTSSGVSADYSSPGANLWITAPGGEMDGTSTSQEGLISTDLTGCAKGYSKSNSQFSFENGSHSLNKNCNYTSTLEGTSFASPIVSGAVALLLETNSSLTWRDVKYILAKTARVNFAPGPYTHPHISKDASVALTGVSYDRGSITNAEGFSFHNWYGFGLLDITAAVNMAKNFISPLGADFTLELLSRSNLDLTIPDHSSVGATDSITFNNSNPLKIESIELKVTTSGAPASDLGIEITSPRGMTTTVLNYNSNIVTSNLINSSFLINAFYQESSAGTWTIKVVDAKNNSSSGKLVNWSLTMYGAR